MDYLTYLFTCWSRININYDVDDQQQQRDGINPVAPPVNHLFTAGIAAPHEPGETTQGGRTEQEFESVSESRQ